MTLLLVGKGSLPVGKKLKKRMPGFSDLQEDYNYSVIKKIK